MSAFMDPFLARPDLRLNGLPVLLSVSIILFLTGFVAFRLREHHRRLATTRGLANAAFESLLICNESKIVSVNNNFLKLIGCPSDTVAGTRLAQYLADQSFQAMIFDHPNQPIETTLLRHDGTAVPVEIIQRKVDFYGRPHHAMAVRDLRASKEAERRIRFLSEYDELTGLPNRTSFVQNLDQLIESGQSDGLRIAVVCIDLDRFTEINEVLGQAMGDLALRFFSRNVSRELKDGEMLVRLGGDEFAIMVPGIAAPETASRTAESVLTSLRDSGKRFGIEIAASIGIAICPDDAIEWPTLLSCADTALYHAKKAGGGTFRFFDAAMSAALRERRFLEHELRDAIEYDEFRLVYQPLKNIRSGEVIGFEALLRWRNSLRGEVSPAEFVPIAEYSGDILAIGAWVLKTACREAANWRQPLTVAVNVSAVQIHHTDFVSTVQETLQETGLDPGRLELEITETALVSDFHRALEILRKIKAMGISITIDDFGIGYSSLANLRAFPFDKIKIDRSFVTTVHEDVEGAAIVRFIVGLGRALNLPVLAEGVETRAELDFLEGELCDEAQGYLLGRPADIESYRQFTLGIRVVGESHPRLCHAGPG
ncbi:MAG: EAL domain-containing protein [Alphaproteobacteria bacterium]|nr:EAL domain-containing protein [Alphaproteobacteria bacterium]